MRQGFFFGLATLTLSALHLQAQSKSPAMPKVDALIRQEMAERQIPGLSLAVVRNGTVIYAKGYGKESIEYNSPATPTTVYLLASITKTFTATLVMMLVEDGKLGIDDPIEKYLTDAPKSWSGITIRHLLNHTAGLKDRFEGKAPNDWKLAFSTQQMYDSAKEQPLDFKPGERLQYSDQGYFLLGMILEKATEKSYRALLKERIFTPLQMNQSSTSNLSEIVPHLAQGYSLFMGKQIRNNRRTDYGVVSHFGMTSTVLDMAKFDAALRSGKLLKKSSLDQMYAPGKLANGENAVVGGWDYGFGWFLDEFFGHRIIQHGGSTGTAFWKYPDDGITVIVLTNLEQIAGGDATGIAKDVAALFVAGTTWASVKPGTDPIPAKTIATKEELVRLAAGKPDQNSYEPNYWSLLKPTVPAQSRAMTQLGTLNSFTYLGGKPRGKGSAAYYRAKYEKATVYFTVRMNADGKITHILGQAN